MAEESESIIEEEVNVLEAIYIHELEVMRNDSNEVTDMILQLHPATADNLDQQYVCMTLVLGIPKQYPHEIPNIQIKNPRGIGEEEVQSTLEAMLALSEERRGEAMLYELIELAKESLTEGNIPRCACMICLEHFVEGDNFQKTSCYHYFHDDCLGRYVKHVLNQEPEVNVAHAKPEPKKVVCPVCREEINYTEDNFPETPVEERFIYFPTDEMKQYQAKMAAMLEKQRQSGGLIDLEAEKNKFLLKQEDVIYLNPARSLSNTSPSASSDNLEELASEREDPDSKYQGSRPNSVQISASNKGRGRNFQGASHSSGKSRCNFGGKVDGKTDRGSRRPDFGGRSRKGYGYDHYEERSYSGRDREFSQRNESYKTKKYDDYDYDGYDDDYDYMETHNQRETYQSRYSKPKGDDLKDSRTRTVRNDIARKSENQNSSGSRESSSKELNDHTHKSSSKYHDERRYRERYKDEYHRSNSSRNDRIRIRETDGPQNYKNRQGKPIRDDENANTDPLTRKSNGDRKDTVQDLGVNDDSNNNDRELAADSVDNTNYGKKSPRTDSPCSVKSDKANSDTRKQSGVQSKNSPRSKETRHKYKHFEESRTSERPQSGSSYGRGRGRRPYRDVDKSEAGDFKGRDNHCYKNRDRENDSSKTNMSKKNTDSNETAKTTCDDKHRVPKTNDQTRDSPKSLPTENAHKHLESPKARSGDYKRRMPDDCREHDRTDLDTDLSQDRNGAKNDSDKKSEFKGRGRGRGYNRNRITDERTFSKSKQDHEVNEAKSHSVDKIIDKIMDIKVNSRTEDRNQSLDKMKDKHVDTKREAKVQDTTGATNDVFNKSSSDTKPSVPPGFCVKPPPGF